MRINIALLLFVNIITAQKTKIDSLFIQFKKDCFYRDVYASKLSLEDLQQEIIPVLIKTLSDTSFVKLTCTADLIYPGADVYYGHGHYIPYNLDWISVRAGWLLEDLTFQDFGYKTIGVDEDYLFNLIKTNYKEYLEKGNYDLEWKNKTPKEKMMAARKLQAKIAVQWWNQNRNNWTRLNAIKEALKSNNVNRISNVTEFLRSGETKCDGLNQTIFREEIKPLAKILSGSDHQEIKEIAALLNEETLDYWQQNRIKLDQKER